MPKQQITYIISSHEISVGKYFTNFSFSLLLQEPPISPVVILNEEHN
jgi:hypothetical protein